MAFHIDKETGKFTYTCDYCRETKIASDRPGMLFEIYAKEWRQSRDEDGERRDMCPNCWKRRWHK